MRFATGIAAGIMLAAAATTVAAASPMHLSDAQFIAASRCAGLMNSKALGTPDGGALTKLVKDQGWGRSGYIYDQADQARDQAQRDAGGSGAEQRARLIAERDGVCRTFLDTATAGAPAAGHSS